MHVWDGCRCRHCSVTRHVWSDVWDDDTMMLGGQEQPRGQSQGDANERLGQAQPQRDEQKVWCLRCGVSSR